VSSNKLSGTLSGDYVINPNSSVDLTVNRLSGVVPVVFKEAANVNIWMRTCFIVMMRACLNMIPLVITMYAAPAVLILL
jgi:hypothetical protein